MAMFPMKKECMEVGVSGVVMTSPIYLLLSIAPDAISHAPTAGIAS